MRRIPLLVVVVAGLGLGATALAQGGGDADPYSLAEPDVGSGEVLRLPASAPGCDAQRSATVRVRPPPGAVLGYVRVRVDGRELARLTGIPRAASATVRVPLSGGRLTATAETLGGQRLKSSRVYADCSARRDPAPAPGVGGGGEG